MATTVVYIIVVREFMNFALRHPFMARLLSQGSSSLGGGRGLVLSVRELLSWAGFITALLPQSSEPVLTATEDAGFQCVQPYLRPWEAYVHGAALVLLDGMGLGAGLSPASIAGLRKACVAVLAKQVKRDVCCDKRDICCWICCY